MLHGFMPVQNFIGRQRGIAFPSHIMQRAVQLKKNATQNTARYAREKYTTESVISTAAIRISVILLPSK